LVIEAMMDVVAELGFASATVKLVTARARVSRRTFYEFFTGLEDCFMTVLDEGMDRMARVMSDAFAVEDDWLDGLLGAEAAVLTYLDSEPVLARVLLVEALGAGAWALERRERNIGILRDLILEHWPILASGGPFPPLAAVGVMASVLGIMQGHLVRGDPAPLLSLLGPLMGVIVGPYLDAEGVSREIERGSELARELLARPGRPKDGAGPGRRRVAGVDVPVGLLDPRAHRARLCLSYVVKHPGVSNNEVGAGIGVPYRGQVTKLLDRLAALGLLSKRAGAPGHPNAWLATPAGKEAALALAGAGKRSQTVHGQQ
jgi:AcrR family transcriptional regulator